MVSPAGDKDILANSVFIKENVIEIMTSDFRGSYDTVRGSTEVEFENDLEPMKLGIST